MARIRREGDTFISEEHRVTRRKQIFVTFIKTFLCALVLVGILAILINVVLFVFSRALSSSALIGVIVGVSLLWSLLYLPSDIKKIDGRR